MKKVALYSVLIIVFVNPGLCQEYDTLVDKRDGKEYKTVKIGEHWWFAENLNYDIPLESYCYGEDDKNCEKYGRLYKWSAALKACPDGWHLPKKSEWNNLIYELGGEKTAPGQMKSPDWTFTGLGARAKYFSGFDALPGGYYNYENREYNNIDKRAYFWIKEAFGSDKAIFYVIYSDTNSGVFLYMYRPAQLSVRCMKNYTGKLGGEDELKDWW
ncbi:MAG: hypothetical protein K8R53_09870 [Bacteroidales bacterium]|nr:hypothetical protein [Bacteroidales bacterium]